MSFFKSDDEAGATKPQRDAKVVPLLPLRDIVVFPTMVVPLFVGRPKSIKALEEAVAGGRELLLAAQRVASKDDPDEADIHRIGTLGSIIQLLRLPDQTVKVLVEGRSRAHLRSFTRQDPHFACAIELIDEPEPKGAEVEALVRSIHTTFENYVKLNKKVPAEVLGTVTQLRSAGRLADTVAAHLNLKLEDRQRLLELVDPAKRLEDVFGLLQAEIEVLEVEKRIRGRVKKQMERSHKEYYLNEQMRAIQKELGERDEFKNEIGELEEQLKAKKMPDEARVSLEAQAAGLEAAARR